MIHTPVFAVAASSTFMWLCTIHGWRPTSVTTQPASIVITESTPGAAAIAEEPAWLFGHVAA